MLPLEDKLHQMQLCAVSAPEADLHLCLLCGPTCLLKYIWLLHKLRLAASGNEAFMFVLCLCSQAGLFPCNSSSLLVTKD